MKSGANMLAGLKYTGRDAHTRSFGDHTWPDQGEWRME